MSAAGTATALSPIPNAKPFKPGYDPRRQVGPKLSPEEIEFREAVNKHQIPRANDALTKLLDAALAALAEGDVLGGSAALERWAKICGLIRKPSDDGAIHETAKAIVGEMLATARERRNQP